MITEQIPGTITVNTHQRLLSLCICALFTPISFAESIWQSPPQQATLLELFTSEGCSSCPPADRWLSRWNVKSELWSEVFPVAFHVDYWDDLGWPDKFASPSFSQRQRNYRQQRHSASVYTPAFMVNGQEWRGFFSRKPFPFTPLKDVGVLKATLSGQQLTAAFTPDISLAESLTLHIALIGMNISNDIYAGENHGKKLRHDFVALDYYNLNSSKKSDHYQWQHTVSLKPIKGEQIDALVFWVSEPQQMTPIQVTGGLIQP